MKTPSSLAPRSPSPIRSRAPEFPCGKPRLTPAVAALGLLVAAVGCGESSITAPGGSGGSGGVAGTGGSGGVAGTGGSGGVAGTGGSGGVAGTGGSGGVAGTGGSGGVAGTGGSGGSGGSGGASTVCVGTTVACPITNGVGERTCAAGVWSPCAIAQCDPGYTVASDQCVSQQLSGSTVAVDDTNVNSVLAAAACGDTIVFTDGTYAAVDIDIANKRCTRDDPLLLIAQTVGGVSFSGSCSVDITASSYVIVDGFAWVDATRSGHLINLDDTSYSVLSNNSFTRSGASSDVSGTIHLETNCHHNVVKASYFEDLTSIGFQIRVWAGQGGDNQHNAVRRNHFEGSGFTSELIQLGNGMYDDGHASPSMGDPDLFTVVEHNLFVDVNYVAELVSDKTSSNIHRHNTFRNVCDSITLRHGTNTTVASNYFFDSRGIRLYDDNHTIVNNYMSGACTSSSWSGIIIGNGEVTRPDMSDAANHYPTRNALIAYNTLIGVTRRHMNFGPIGSVQATNLEVVGNIVVNDDYDAFAGVGNVGTVTFATNIIHSTGSGSPGYTGAGVTVTDPLLAFDGTLYRPTASSPAVNGATRAMAFDIEGKVRDATPDIGALAYGTSPVYPPLTGADVGPGSGGRMDFVAP